MKNILALSVVVLSLACDRPSPVLEISNHLWPEGTVISVISRGSVIASSALYGDHVRIRVPRSGAVRVRVATPEVIASLSPEMAIEDGVTAYRLPVPVMRRRIGTVNLGIGCISPGEYPFFRSLVENSAASITSLSLAPDAPSALETSIAHAHTKVIEVILRADCRNEDSPQAALKFARARAVEAERVGADGILFIPGDASWGSGGFPGGIRELAASVHGRGMSLTVAITPEALKTFHPAALFGHIPASECPDELLLLCSGDAPTDENPAVVSLQQMEDALLKIIEKKIPLSRVSVEVRLSALAVRRTGKTFQPVTLAPGELRKILAEAGAGSAIRMGDGSLKLGYKGVEYAFEDMTGIARKMRFLRSGEFARIHAVHVLYDGLGVRPDGAGIQELAKVIGEK